MTAFEASLLVGAANTVGESPVWDATTGSLYWVDIIPGVVHRLSSDGAVRHWRAPLMIGSIVLAETGGLLAATADGFARLDLNQDMPVLDFIAPVLAENSGKRFNDGACDRQGRFWSGTMRLQPDPAQPDGMLYRLDHSGAARPMLGGFLIQNGLAWSPDGRVMYVSDSHPTIRRVWAFDYDGDTGTMSDRRLFLGEIPGRPDGAAMDVDGCYWIAATDAGKILRITPGGSIDAEISVPVPNPTNLCFGGPDMRRVFITSLRSSKAGPEEGGDVFCVDLPYQGMIETRAKLYPKA